MTDCIPLYKRKDYQEAVVSRYPNHVVRLFGYPYLRLCYKIRKLYVWLNPFFGLHSRADCVQYIMRDAPLIQQGIPFFLEPWVQPCNYWCVEGRDSLKYPFAVELVIRFAKSFAAWARAKERLRDGR